MNFILVFAHAKRAASGEAASLSREAANVEVVYTQDYSACTWRVCEACEAKQHLDSRFPAATRESTFKPSVLQAFSASSLQFVSTPYFLVIDT